METFKKLPDDLIVEILHKLPVELLCRFKTVSKSWLSLIQTIDFNDKVPLKLEIVEDRNEGNLYVYSIDEKGTPTYLNKLDHYTIKDRFDATYLYSLDFLHCNGLLFSYDEFNNALNVCNLTSYESIQLPLPDEDYGYSYIGNYKFGFDSASKKYKVVYNINGSYNNDASDVTVLTLDNNSVWKSVKEVPPRLGTWWSDDAITVNGDLFWIDDFPKKDAKIISFNFEHEKFVAIELPDKLKEKDCKYSLFDFNGKLCFVERSECGLEIVNCWMLKNIANNVWVKILKNVTLQTENAINLKEISIFSCSTRRGEILIVAVSDKVLEIFSFSLLSRKFKKIKVSGFPFELIWVTNHVENYCSLKEVFG